MKITKFLTGFLAIAIMLTSVSIPTLSASEETEPPVASTDAAETNESEAPEVSDTESEAPEVSDTESETLKDVVDNTEDSPVGINPDLGAVYISRMDTSSCGDLRIWGEVSGLAGVYLDQFRVEFYTSEGELVAATTLAQKFTCEGMLSWHLRVDGASDDEWWTYEWVDGNPNPNKAPATAKFIINGQNCGSVSVRQHEVFYTRAWADYFVAEYNGVYYTRLQDVIDAGATDITLLTNVDEMGTEVDANSGEYFVKILGKNVTINFNGKTLTGSIYVDSASTVKFINGTITTYTGNASSGVESVGGNIEFTDMTVFTTARHAVRVKGGTAKFNGGHYETQGTETMHGVNISHASTVTINAGTYVGPKGYSTSGNAVMVADNASQVYVNGGTFKNAAGGEGPICAAQGLVISGGIFEDTTETFRYHSFLSKEKNYIAITLSEGVYEVVEVTNWIQIADTAWFTGDKDEYTVTNAKELAGLAALVNGGNSFEGKTIYLGDNIDLGGLAWTPIGTSTISFKGSFNGNGHTVSNLTINEPTMSHQALFGNVWGYSEAAYPYISDITLTNVNVTGKNYVAGLVANAFCYDIINCHVNGDIYILNSGNNNYTGAIAGHSYANILNCSVKDTGVDGNGYIQGCYSGGIAGWTGEGNYLIENCTVENIDFVEESGTIVGFFNAYVMIKDCTAKNCTINANTGSGLGYTGLIAGDNRFASEKPNFILNCTLENVTGKVTVSGAEQELTQLVPDKAYTFVGNDVEFDTDPDAVKVGTSKFIAGTFDKEPIASHIAEGYTVEEVDGKFVIIAVPVVKNETTGETYSSLQSAIDAANAGDVIVLLGDVSEKGTEVEANSGEFFVQILNKSVTIDLAGYTFYGSFYLNSGAALNIDNGYIRTLEGNKSSCIESVGGSLVLGDKLDALSTVRHTIRVKGGTAVINGGRYECQGTSTNHALNISHASNVTINNGTFIGNEDYASGSGGNAVMIQHAESIVNIYGGDFSKASGVEGPVSVSEGLTIHNGAFDDWYTGYDKFVTETKAVIYNEDTARYILVDAVARIESANKSFATLADAIAAAKSGETVTVLVDINDLERIFVKTTVALDLNGKALTATGSSRMFEVQAGGDLTIKDSSTEKTGKIVCLNPNNSTSNRQVIRVVGGKLTIEGGTFEVAQGKYARTIVAQSGATVIIKDGTFIGGDSTLYVDNSTATVENGTFTSADNAVNGTNGANITIENGTFNAKVQSWGASVLTINGGTITALENNQYAVGAFGTTQLTITGGEINHNGTSAGAAQGIQIADSAVANISGGRIFGTSHGVVIAHNATITVSDNAEISGGFGIAGNATEGQNTTINITGGTITGDDANGGAGIWHVQDGTLTVSGGVISSIGGYKGTVSITGGEITSYKENTFGRVITGGIFRYDPSKNVADTKAAVLNEETGCYEIVEAVALIGEQGYATLQAAMDAAKSGDTLTILSNTAEWPEAFALKEGVTVIRAQGVTLEAPEGYVWDADGKLTAILIGSKVGNIRYYNKTTGKYELYLFCGIDSLDYREVGFIVTVGDTTKTLTTQNVYGAVNVKMNGDSTTLSAAEFSEVGYETVRIFAQGINFAETYKDSAVTYKPYAVKMDGTIIYGKEATIKTVAPEQ